MSTITRTLTTKMATTTAGASLARKATASNSWCSYSILAEYESATHLSIYSTKHYLLKCPNNSCNKNGTSVL